MRYTEAKQFIAKLNENRYWCGGRNTWDARSHSRYAHSQPHRAKWDVIIVDSHVRNTHWEFNFLRWHVSLCRQFIKLKIERIDGKQSKPKSKGTS